MILYNIQLLVCKPFSTGWRSWPLAGLHMFTVTQHHSGNLTAHAHIGVGEA